MIPVTTTLSSRGQVVIPEDVRKRLHLEPGTAFLVLAKGDTIVLQRLAEPPWKEFDDMVTEAQRQGHHTNLAMQSLKKAMNRIRYTR